MKIGIRIACTMCSYDEVMEVELPFADNGDICPNCGTDGTGYIAEIIDVATVPMQQEFRQFLNEEGLDGQQGEVIYNKFIRLIGGE